MKYLPASNHLNNKSEFYQELILFGLAVVIGLSTAWAAIGFNLLIKTVDSISYGSDYVSGIYRERHIWLFFLPAVGGLLVGLIARFYSHEAIGHGVPEVMDAMVRKNCKIPFHMALARAITAALTIGSGGSAGPEGPIIQIGAAFASSAGSLLRVVRYQMPVLIACGVASGIAAIFHAPIAGVLFAIEVFLKDINFRKLSPVLIASVISRVMVASIHGDDFAIFPLSDITVYTFHWNEFGNYIILGLFCALVAVIFIRILYLSENLFEKIPIPNVFKPAIGGMLLGAVGLVTVVAIRGSIRGEPLIFGKGYAFISVCIGTAAADRFTNFELTIGILCILLAAKILASALTLGSGGSGGIFAPSLFVGATTGYIMGMFVQRIPLYSDVNPATYSLVGMASVLAAATHAPMAAIVMLFEITHNYKIILPVMFSCTISLIIARLFCPQSVASFQLYNKGIKFGLHAKMDLLRKFSVQDIMIPNVVTVKAEMPLQEIILNNADSDVSDFIVTDKHGRYAGILCDKDLRNTLLHPEAIPLIIGDDIKRTNVPAVSVNDTLDKILEIFSEIDVNSLPVTNGKKPKKFVAMVTRTALMRQYMNELQRTS